MIWGLHNNVYVYSSEFSNEAIRRALDSCFCYENLFKFLKTVSGKASELYIYNLIRAAFADKIKNILHLNVDVSINIFIVYLHMYIHIFDFDCSPEIIQSLPYGEKADVWALGCVFYQMATLNPPFFSSNMLTLATKVMQLSVMIL